METAESGEREKQNLAHLGDIEIALVVKLGRKTLKLCEALALRPGSVIALNKMAGEPFELRAGQVLFGEGEITVVDPVTACRLTQLVPVGNQERAT